MAKFLSFEGGEGSGKTTQWQLLTRALQERGIPLVATREPGGTPAGMAIRRLLLTPEGSALEPLPELLLYAADRAHHVAQVIAPALQAGKWVLCDRYQDSTTVYQGMVRGIAEDRIQTLAQWATGGLKPHLTFLFDVAPEVGLQRSKSRLAEQNSREDRFETEAVHFHEKVRQGFLKLAKREPERFVVLDASLDPETLHQRVLNKVLTLK